MEQSSGSIKVVLHGHFKKICPVDYTFHVKTPAEALKALSKQVKGFRPVPGQEPVLGKVIGFEDGDALFMPTDKREIHLVPAFVGGGGFVKIIIGAIFIVVGAYTGQGWLVSIGIGLALGGVMELLSPAPKPFEFNNGQQTGDPPGSKYLGAPGNTVAIGTRIPLLVGTHIASGQFLSFNIEATDVPL